MTDNRQMAAFAIFAGPVDNDAVARFSNGLARAMSLGITEAHILFQSGGGLVGDGVCLYNLFRGLQMSTVLYNAGTVCSAAAIAFLGARKRVFSPHATFMLHRSQTQAQGGSAIQLKHLAHSASLDDARMEAIIRESCALTRKQFTIFRDHNLWLTAEESLKAGIATDIGEFAPPRGEVVSTI